MSYNVLRANFLPAAADGLDHAKVGGRHEDSPAAEVVQAGTQGHLIDRPQQNNGNERAKKQKRRRGASQSCHYMFVKAARGGRQKQMLIHTRASIQTLACPSALMSVLRQESCRLTTSSQSR